MEKSGSGEQKPRVVKGMPSVELTRDEFARRFRQRTTTRRSTTSTPSSTRSLDVAWRSYIEYRKSPRTRRAGDGFADPDYELSLEWLAARARDPAKPSASRRSRLGVAHPLDQRLRAQRPDLSGRDVEDLPARQARAGARSSATRLRGRPPRPVACSTSEYGRVIYPCKACVSTAQPLCHWPCSCYPNHALGQTQDWMNEIYPRWVAAHGVMIVTPVNWYHVPSVLKLMIDRLVCADGGNPDPTSTGGKDAARAKALELAGWDYPKHLAGRAFARGRARRRRRRRGRALRAVRLARLDGADPGGRERRARSLHRLLPALRHEPRRPRPRHARCRRRCATRR